MERRKQFFLPLFIAVALLLQMSSASLFSFPNSCRKIKNERTLTSFKCNELISDPDQKIQNHLNLLHVIHELKFPELVLIIADDMEHGISLARFLTADYKLERNRNRQDIPNDKLMAFDFIRDTIYLFENRQIPTTFFVYPRHTTDDQLAAILALEVVKAAKNVKIILTSNASSKYERKFQFQRALNIAAKLLRNPTEYANSICFVATSEEFNGRHDISSNEILQNVDMEKEEFVGIIERYLSNSETTGRQLAKFLISNQDNIIFADGFTSDNFRKIVTRLKALGQTEVNTRNLESSWILLLDCIFDLANRQLSSVVNSLQLAVMSQISNEGIDSQRKGTLTGVFNLSGKLDQLYQSLSSFFDCTNTMNVEILSGCFRNVSLQLEKAGFAKIANITSATDDYLSLLCDVHHQSLTIQPKVEYLINPEKWIRNLKHQEQSLKRTNDWYQKLITTFQNVDRKPSEDISQDLTNLANNLLQDDPVPFHDVETAKFALEIVKSNAIKMDANFKIVRIANEIKLQVRGKFLRLSQILNNSHFSQNVRALELFALQKIIIDQDLIAGPDGLDVFIFAPIWEIVMNRSIVLDGVSGNQIRGNWDPKARRGNKLTNHNGMNGQAGVAGGAAGTFYGLAQTVISADSLKISLNGGDGSDGQDGGDAADGEDGETPSSSFLIANLNRHRCAWPRNNPFIYPIERPEEENYYVPAIGTMIRLKYKSECHVFGLEGYPGGHGGHGGISGPGGVAGSYKLLPLEDSSIFPVKLSADDGADGKGGLGGRPGKGGFTRKVTLRNHDYFDYSVTENVTDARARDGQEGIRNASDVGKQLTRERPILQTFGQTANLYKRYLLAEIVNSGSSKYIDLYRRVIENRLILEEYDTLTLVEEFMDLEQHYYKVKNKSDTQFLYQAWKNRLDHYSANRKPGEETDEYSEVLRNLESIVSTKIKRLIENSHSFLVFMLVEYLTESQQQVRHLHNAKTVVVIKNTNKKYTEEYDDKIEEAQRIIQDELQTNLTKHNDELSGEMEMLLRRISRLAELEANNAEELVKKSAAMQEKALIKTFNDIFSLLNAGLGIINPALATIGTKISSAGSMVLNFIDDTADTNIVEVMIPNMVDKSREFFDNWVDMKKGFQKLAIDENLEMVRSRRLELAAKGNNVEPLQRVERSFTELRDLVEQKSLNRDVITNLNDMIETEENFWQKLNAGRKKIYTESLKVLKHLKTYTRVKQMLGDFLGKCEDLKSPRKIDGISDEIERAFVKTRRLRNFKEEVLAKMIPLLRKIRETTNVANLRSSSVAFLDFKNFQMQQYFEDVFSQIEILAKDFKLESYFERTLKKMQSVVNMVLSTYTRIEEYVTTMRNADYEKDLYLAPFDITYVKDPKLSMSLAKMIQRTYANLVLDDYSKWMASFKQYIFPFADDFMGVYESSIPEVDDLLTRAQDAGKRLEIYGSKINKKRAEFREFENTVMTKFGYSLPPFHVWTNTSEIDRLLSGERITLHANISEHKNLNAVKFSDIWVRFGAQDPMILNQMKSDLQGFSLILDHHGDSYYRCDDRIFLIQSERHRTEKVLSDEKIQHYEDNFAVKIMPTEKGKSDCILSPYATWSIEIGKRDEDKSYAVFEDYKSKVNIELVGLGQYSDKNLNVCKSNLRKYYENEL